jgi:large subunit ribosomal protein L21
MRSYRPAGNNTGFVKVKSYALKRYRETRGGEVSFDEVLMFSDDDNVLIGQPTLPNIKVSGHIVGQGRSKKVIVFKYKRRKGYRKKRGHRQDYTALKIDSIKIA